MKIPQVGDPCYYAFERYKDVPETVPLGFLEDNVDWVTSKLSGAVGVLGAEAL